MDACRDNHLPRRQPGADDSLVAVGASLQANAYGIYLTHYVFTAWLSWLLLPQAWGGLAKGLVVIGGAVALSWLTTMALRRMPLLGRIL